MKKKNLLMTVIAIFGLATITSAQVPSYVPTTGLVGYWPFNGNANDESGNGNNGTVNGATLTSDRYGASNMAYSFDGVNDGLEVNNTILPNVPNSYTINFWCLLDTFNLTANGYTIFDDCDSLQWYGKGRFLSNSSYFENSNFCFREYNNNIANDSAFIGQWINYTCVLNLQNSKFLLYRNATLVDSANFIASSYVGGDRKTQIGRCQSPISYNGMDYFTSFWDGKIDDFGVWNRALSQQEITDLYNSINCFNDLVISPASIIQNTGGNATFTATTSDSNVSYIWQSDLGQGFQTLNNYGNYSGVNTNTLTIANVQLANHNQPIRAVSNSINCIDTSNVATIQIADTCQTTIYDTLLTTVTDTLIINTTLSLPAPNNENTILIYPNPASDHITIDNGNFAAMAGYSIKIENNAGQQVFQSAINQQQFYLDLSSWTGNGLYFVHLIDSQNNTVTVRKIVLQ
jgi:hypothetical protein